MAVTLNEDWTAEIVGQMHKYRLTSAQLAAECYNPRFGSDGYSVGYLSEILNGRRVFKSQRAKEIAKCTIYDALARLIERVENDEEEHI